RKGAATDEAKAIVAELSARGVTVEAKAVDITSRRPRRLRAWRRRAGWIDRGAKHLVLAGARARPPTRPRRSSRSCRPGA
ncbi:hypothetical protein CTI14_63890, partial [Methylobacterium radiotolerans]